MLQAIAGRRDQISNIEDNETKKLVSDLIYWNYNQLKTNFFKELLILTLSEK
jgi:macrodomain Ter protein organizer (MatP/YcbG family)